MPARSRSRWAIMFLMGFLAFFVGALSYAAVVIAHSLAQIGTAMVGAVIEGLIQNLASTICLLMAMEILRAAIIWATQGPLAAIPLVIARVAIWQGL